MRSRHPGADLPSSGDRRALRPHVPQSLPRCAGAGARHWLAVNTSWALTDEERAARLAEQGGVCANPSCRRPDSDTSRWSRLATDHDHASPDNNVRGLLCRLCNASIGMAPGDSLTGVLGLAVYLAAYEHSNLVEAIGDLLDAVVGSASDSGEATA
jgi:Recombination endonuclease VII